MYKLWLILAYLENLSDFPLASIGLECSVTNPRHSSYTKRCAQAKNLFMKFRLLSLLILLLLDSCSLSKKSLTDKIVGKWAIEKIQFDNEDYKSYLYSNVLIFKENADVSIPETVHFIKDPSSTWKILDNNKLVIESSNLAFKDTFNITFTKRNKDKPRGMELKSDSIYITAYNLFDLEK